jgi:hypothetical protein
LQTRSNVLKNRTLPTVHGDRRPRIGSAQLFGWLVDHYAGIALGQLARG